MKTKEVWIVYNEKGFVGIFSSENKAEKSTADYIVKTAIPPRMDDEIKKLKELYIQVKQVNHS